MGAISVSGDARTGGKDPKIREIFRKVSIWILCTWNGEIPSIFELPLGFSVEIAVAGAKNECF